MTGGKIENGLERGFVKHRLNYLLINDPKCLNIAIKVKKIIPQITERKGILRFEIKQSKENGLRISATDNHFKIFAEGDNTL